jgi:CubicO group peptidase (beta-lactamase class C family)
MDRRTFLGFGLSAACAAPISAALRKEQMEKASEVLSRATDSELVAAATLYVSQGRNSFARSFGKAANQDAMFLLGSISKPVCVTAMMTLFEQGAFTLDDRLRKFLPGFTGEGRDDVTIHHLLTHTSGLPDQLPENDSLRSRHAPLVEFAEKATRTPLGFRPGSRYQYSSMGILLATRVAELLSGLDIQSLVARRVLEPLQMRHTAQGLGRFRLEDMVPVQTERAAPESGGGDPHAKQWDWNSPYWRNLGAPWGGTHASAPDIGRFLAEFLYENGKVLKPDTVRLMVTNRNAPGITPRGLGMNVGASAGSPGCSEKTFGHTGSTGTICWADPASRTICVVLTSLPAQAVSPHPRDTAAAYVAAAAKD